MKRGNSCKKRLQVRVGLTKAQSEVFFYLTQEFLTPKQISIRRETTTQSVYNIIKILRKKGLLNAKNLDTKTGGCTLQPLYKGKPNTIRLHGEEYHINILYKDPRYKEIIKNNNIIYHDGNTIRLFRDVIEIYSGHSFFGKTAQEADSESNKYWSRFFFKLEEQLKVIIIKLGKYNIKRVNAHYSEINNELAEDAEKKGEKIRFKASEDNKTWFVIDNSFNLHEAETQHPDTAKQDIEKLKKQFDDIRNNNPPTNTELYGEIKKMMGLLKIQMQVNRDTAEGLKLLVDYMGLQIPKIPPKSLEMPHNADYIG